MSDLSLFCVRLDYLLRGMKISSGKLGLAVATTADWSNHGVEIDD